MALDLNILFAPINIGRRRIHQFKDKVFRTGTTFVFVFVFSNCRVTEAKTVAKDSERSERDNEQSTENILIKTTGTLSA